MTNQNDIIEELQAFLESQLASRAPQSPAEAPPQPDLGSQSPPQVISSEWLRMASDFDPNSVQVKRPPSNEKGDHIGDRIPLVWRDPNLLLIGNPAFSHSQLYRSVLGEKFNNHDHHGAIYLDDDDPKFGDVTWYANPPDFMDYPNNEQKFQQLVTQHTGIGFPHADWGFESKVAAPQIMYHLSPQANRASIQENGLRTEYDQTVEDFGFSTTKGIYLSLTPGEPSSNDVWQVDVNGLKIETDPWILHSEITSDLPGGEWYVVYQDIGPERLKLLT